jgi:hypothetical protein
METENLRLHQALVTVLLGGKVVFSGNYLHRNLRNFGIFWREFGNSQNSSKAWLAFTQKKFITHFSIAESEIGHKDGKEAKNVGTFSLGPPNEKEGEGGGAVGRQRSVRLLSSMAHQFRLRRTKTSSSNCL